MFGDEMQAALRDMFLGMMVAIPKFLTALFIIIIGIIISKAVNKLVATFFEKLKVDEFSDKINQIELLFKNKIEIKLSQVLGKISFYILMLIFAMTAVGALDMPILAQLIQDFIKFVPNLIAAFLILIVGLVLADSLKNLVAGTCKSLGMPSANIIAGFVFYFVFINILIVALSQAQINTEFFAQNISIIIAGGVFAFSIGYGIASKDLVASFLASFYTKDKLNIGDKVTLGSVTGKIIELDKSSVTVDTGDKKVIIPLNKILVENIEIHH